MSLTTKRATKLVEMSEAQIIRMPARTRKWGRDKHYDLESGHT